MNKTQNLFYVALVYLLSIHLFSCTDQGNTLGNTFDLKNPDTDIPLSRNIKNVAGITIDTSRTIWAINDTSPLIFSIDLLAKQTTNQMTIANDRDYGGVHYLNGYVYVARNDGFIKRIAVEKNKAVKTYFNPNNQVKNVGGLCNSADENALYLVNGTSSHFDIYSMDLSNGKFSAAPMISVSIADIKQQHSALAESTKTFNATGIATDPTNGDIYMSITDQYVVQVNNEGIIQSVYPLPQSSNGEIAGICFDKKGDLMIAYQGNDTAAMIYRYKRK